MMFEMIKFEAEHLKELVEEPINIAQKPWFEAGYAKTLEEDTLAFTLRFEQHVLACVGVKKMWENRGYLWSMFSDRARAHSVSVYRGLKMALPLLPFNRIEMDVPCDFILGHKRALFFGFKQEVARARKYLPDGGDVSLYAWVRE